MVVGMGFIGFYAVLLTAVAVVGCRAASTGAGDAAEVRVPILTHHQGNDSALATLEVHLIRSREELDRLGSRALSRLAVDFEAQSLLLVALGEKRSGGHAAKIESIQRRGSTLHLRVVATAPGEGQMVTMALTYPYAAAVIAKIEGIESVQPQIESVRGKQAR